MAEEGYHIVLTTAGSIDEAEKIAETLVDEKLAACVNLMDRCKSIYRWKGRIVRDNEVLMVAKTHRSRLERLTERVSELHSYEVPEVIAVELSSGSRVYLDFLKEAMDI